MQLRVCVFFSSDFSSFYVGSQKWKSYNMSPGETFLHQKRIYQKKHHCPYCSYCTGFKSFLNRHMCKHTGERPFACSFCGKQFSRKHTLQCHINSVHGKFSKQATDWNAFTPA